MFDNSSDHIILYNVHYYKDKEHNFEIALEFDSMLKTCLVPHHQQNMKNFGIR